MDTDKIEAPGRRVTVHDVAAAAGVSLATVDRVLNGRAGVTDATVGRVRAAVDRIGYHRDDTAARLATRRRTDILFVLPPAGTNGFMDTFREAIATAGERIAAERVFLAVRTTDAIDDDRSLARILDAIEPGAFAGVAIVAVDSAKVRHAIARAEGRGVPVVTVVSDVQHSKRSAYVGIDNVAAGRIAATLLGRFVGGRTRSQPVEIGVLIGSHALRDHAERVFGIGDELRRRFPHVTLLPALEGRDDRDRTERQARALLDAHPDLGGLYNAGAGNQGLLAALRGSGHAGRLVVVAHELTAHARDALRLGHFAAILHQDQNDEIEQAVALIRARADGPGARVPRPTRLEIFLEHNLPPLAASR